MREFFENVLIYTGGILAILLWIAAIAIVVIEVYTTVADKDEEA